MIVEFYIDPPFESQKKARFTVVTRTGRYSVVIAVDNGIPLYLAPDCDCEFGSHWGLSGKHKAVNKVCRHINECLVFLEKEAWIDPNWRQKKDGNRTEERKEEIPSS